MLYHVRVVPVGTNTSPFDNSTYNMKKTFATLAVAVGMLASVQAEQTETWTFADLTAGGGTISVPETATAGSGYGNFSLTAVLDVSKVITELTNDRWSVFLGVNSALTDNLAYGLTINGTSGNATKGGIYATKTTTGSLDTSVAGNFGSSFANLEGTLRGDTTYTFMAVTMEVNGAGVSAYLTLVDEAGTYTKFSGTVSGTNTNGWRNTQFGHLDSITYNAGVVKFLSLDNTNLSAAAAYAANAAAITASIPEPTTATLSLLALAGLAARRRRK